MEPQVERKGKGVGGSVKCFHRGRLDPTSSRVGKHGDVVTYPTLNLYYSVGNDGVFLNYAIDQASILLTGSWQTRRARLPKYYKEYVPTLRGWRLWHWRDDYDHRDVL
jgi:hypothetical protein